MFLLSGMLVILDMGSLFIRDVDVALTAAICIVFSVFMCLSVLLAVGYGLFKHIMQRLGRRLLYVSRFSSCSYK